MFYLIIFHFTWLSASVSQIMSPVPPEYIHICKHELFSCKNKTHLPSDRCFCDEVCQLYGDCCLEASPLPFKGSFENISSSATCTIVPNTEEHEKYLFISKCPEKSSLEMSIFCEEDVLTEGIVSRIPVSDNKYPIVYKNIFCAKCFNREHHIDYWTVKYDIGFQADANFTISSTILKNFDKNVMKFVRPHKFNHRQCKSLISQCSEEFEKGERIMSQTSSGKWFENDTIIEDCYNQGVAQVYDSYTDKVYKNAFCALCNNLEHFMCDKISFIMFEVPSMALLLDFNNGEITSDYGHDLKIQKCSAGEIYDEDFDICRTLECDFGYKLTPKGCENDNLQYIQNGTSCSKVNYSNVSYHILGNGSMFLNETNKVISQGNFTIENGTLFICSDLFKKESYDMNSLVKGILSTIGQTVSIIFLILLLLIHFIMKEMRTFPVKCIMCVTAYLLTAQLSFLIGFMLTEYKIICIILSCMTHFSYLNVFLWMQLIAFDAWWTFHKQFEIRQTGGSKKRLVKFAIYSISVSLSIVGLAGIGDVYPNNILIAPLYGEVFCWINSKMALLLYFFVPVSIVIFTNYVFFIITIYHIYKASKSTQTVISNQNRSFKKNQIILYTKLSTIMGLTWLFGVLAPISDAQPLWYLFIIFNSLQGFFIFLAFICNKRTISLIRNKMFRDTSDKQSKTCTDQTGTTQVKNIENRTSLPDSITQDNLC